MKIIYTVEADCDPDPNPDELADREGACLIALEDAVSITIDAAGGAASVLASVDYQ